MRWLLVIVVVSGCRVRFDEVSIADGKATGGDTGGLLTYRDAVLADQPIAYWRFDNTSSVIADVQQNVNGLFSGGCTYGVAGALAQDANPAVHFDGTTCFASFGDNFRFPGSAPMTVEMWVRAALAPAYEHYFTVEVRDVNGPTDGYALFRYTGLGIMAERVIATTNVKTMPFEIAANTWRYLAMVYDGAVMKLYVDGVLVQQQPDTRPLNVVGAIALVGAHSDGAYFMGEMDEVAVYDAALAPARIVLHHQIGVAGPQ